MTYDAPSVGMAIAMVDARLADEDQARSERLKEQIWAMGGFGAEEGKRFCPRGHSNWTTGRDNKRRCLTCRAERNRRARRRN